MTKVEFGTYNFRTETKEGKQYIYDELRKKWVPLTPEEWVRQHIAHYLVDTKGYSPALIAVERAIALNGLTKRFDLVVFNNRGEPKIIVECKAHHEVLNQKVFEQIAVYNQKLRVDYLWVSNGTYNYCCHLKDGLKMLEEVPPAVLIK